MENKICVYAICKNEMKFVDRWLSSLSSEADYVVVLDTGSTDGTYEYLQNDPRVHKVEQRIITPWRFDSARNASLELIPEDADICVVSDFDHIFRPGWGNELKQLFSQGYEEVYGDIIDYDDDGNEIKKFLSKNVHPNKPEWYWERPIHEGVSYHGDRELQTCISDIFVIEHHPDRTKSRDSYLALLEEEYKENSSDPMCAIYYGCELCFHGREDEGLQVFLRANEECDYTNFEEVGYQIQLNIADSYRNMKQYDVALMYAEKAETYNIITRRLYMERANIYFDMGDYESSKEFILKALDVTYNHRSWVESDEYFSGRCYDQLSLVCYQLNDIPSAIQYCKLALEYKPEDERLISNLRYFMKGHENMIKVCVYSICKNEESNVERWYNCIKDADLIYLLDTGSTDKTLEKLSQYEDIHVDQHVFDDEVFDFAKARNLSLSNARELCDANPENSEWVFLSLDLDEFLEDGGIQKIKDNWSSEYDTFRLCGITEGEDGQYVDHKLHSSNPLWSWKRSIHEIIYLPNKKQRFWNVGTTEMISYQHVQDKNKDRQYYEKVLYAYNQDPSDIKTVIYLAWECYNREMFDDFFKYSNECIHLILTNEADEYYLNAQYLLQCYFNCSEYYCIHSQYAVADMWLNKAIRLIEDGKFPRLRRLYFAKARVLWELEQKEIAIDYYKKCLSITECPYSWIEDTSLYNDANINSLISNGYFYFSKPYEALEYANKALELDPSNEVFKENVEQIEGHLASYVEPKKENKICIYAICKNEEQFVEAWLDSMSEADYIVVLDTGSTDRTYELLKNDSRVYRVEQKIISPWRFDTARNESMKLIPDDANILLTTDLDELLEPGWADVIRENWIDGFHVRGTYKYAWSHTEDGQPGRVFYYDKLHDKNWYWTAPVHELLHSDKYDDAYRFSHSLDLFDMGVYLHHYPDQSKSRSTYLPLLELRAKENPEDYYGKYYLSHEYNYRGMYEKSNAVLYDILRNYRDKYDQLEIAACYLFLGDNYRSLGHLDKAIYNYNLAISQEPTYREPYLLAAEIFNEKKMYHIAIAYVKEALKTSYRHYTWVERDDSWREKPDDILSVSYFYLGEKEKSYIHVSNAHNMNPNDTRIQYNLDLITNMK